MSLRPLLPLIAAALALSRLASAQEADSLDVEESTVERAVLTAAPVAVVVAPAAAPGPSRHAFGGTGLVLTLPPGWTTAPLADEVRLPQLARYTVRQLDPASPLFGATLVVERVVGLNPLDRERWRVGQTSYGYPGGVRPVGPATTPIPGAMSLETAGGDLGGASAFVQRGPAYWAVAVVAPTRVWQRHRADVLSLMAGVALP